MSPLTEAKAVLPVVSTTNGTPLKCKSNGCAASFFVLTTPSLLMRSAGNCLSYAPVKSLAKVKNFARALIETAAEAITTAKISGSSVTQNGYCAAAGQASGFNTSSASRGKNAGG